MNKKPTRIIVTLGIIVGFVLLSSVLAYSQAASDPVGSRSVRQVRAIETADLGASNPLGVAFSAQANAFLLLGDQNATQSSGAGATIMMITLFEEDLAGSMSVAGWAPDPLNLTFDDKTDSLLFLDQSAGDLIEMQVGPAGLPTPFGPGIIRFNAPQLGLKTPQGITLDPQGGRLFILDAAVPRIVGITPDGRISHMPLGRLGGRRLRGIAFNPNNGHLYVLSPEKRELYELTDTGQLVSTRDLTPTGLTDPQGMVFAPSGNSTDDPAEMSLYVADSGPSPGSTGRIIEFTLTSSQVSATASSFEVRVAASSDDAEESATGSVNLTSSDLELILDGSNQQTVGMRFNGITIPQGATITNAYVQFQVEETGTAATSLIIRGQAVDNAATFTTATNNISLRPKTSAAVQWSPMSWTTVGEAGLDQRTPNLAALVEEIVARTGWLTGNSLVITITGSGKRTAEAFNGVPAAAPLLHVEYSGGSTNNPPIATDDSASTTVGMAVTIDVVANDTDPNGNLVPDSTNTTCSTCATPTRGTLVKNPGGSFRYTPNAGFTGSDSFVYEICDDTNLCDTATVSIFVSSAGNPAVLVGAGDIARCTSTKDEATAKLLDNIPGTVVALGDNAYPNGTLAEYNDCYGPSWGRHKARTRPSAGNHEYDIAGAQGYFTYFGAAASPLDTNCTSNCKGYYSYDLGAWHIIVLNSNCSKVGGCGTTSPQGKWLKADLAAHPATCTLAYFHHPRFHSLGGETDMQPFWQLLYEAGADVVLNGHKHNYERFALQNPDGVADPAHGIREFVVGTGGTGVMSFNGVAIAPNSEARSNTHGVLKLTLHPTSYNWEFIPIPGKTFTDSGSALCVIP